MIFEKKQFLSQEVENNKRIFLSEIFSSIRTSLKNSIDKFFNKEFIEEERKEFDLLNGKIDKYIEVEEKFASSHQKAVIIGREVADYYRSLIPKSLRQPEKEYAGGSPESKFELYDDYDALREQLEAVVKDVSDENILMHTTEQNNFSQIKESPIKNGTLQQVKFRCMCDGGKAVIDEEIFNLLSDKTNVASADLIWRDLESGHKLELSQLLPTGFEFVPSALRNHKDEFDNEKHKVVRRFIPMSIKSYNGSKDVEGKFAQVGDVITYGDLAKKGGLLSLLHEISHSWQSVYYNESGVNQFELMEMEIVHCILGIDIAKEAFEQGKITKDELENEIATSKISLAKVGVKTDEAKFFNAEATLESDEQKFMDPISHREYVIKSDELVQAIKKYESDERDAWAHAIKVLRFLRSKGINLESELKTIDDFKQVINPCLDSYQRHIGGEIVLGSGRVGFMRD